MRRWILWVHQCAWASWFYAQSAPFPISDITSLQHTDAPEYLGFIPSKRCFPSPEWQIFSIRMHLNILFLYTVSVIFRFLVLQAFSILCVGECLPIKACAFDPYQYRLIILLRSNALLVSIALPRPMVLPWPIKLPRPTLLPRPDTLLQLISTFSPLRISCGRECLAIKVYAFDSSFWLLEPWGTMQTIPAHIFQHYCKISDLSSHKQADTTTPPPQRKEIERRIFDNFLRPLEAL